MRFRIASATKLEKQLRDVAKEAMDQTDKTRPAGLVGLRVHMQVEFPKGEVQRRAAEAGTLAPPEMGSNIGRTCLNAFKGVMFGTGQQVCQLLVTKAWGPIDGLSITAWEIEQKPAGTLH